MQMFHGLRYTCDFANGKGKNMPNSLARKPFVAKCGVVVAMLAICPNSGI